MSTAQIMDAVRQMKVHCQLQIDVNNHEVISARGVLTLLGYNREQANEVLTYIHDAGFNYCLDPMFPSKSRGGDEPTPEFACYWGPDQLLSRVQFIHHEVII